MNWIKVLLINILLLFSFLGMILLAPPFIYSLYEWLTYDKDKVGYDDRSELKIYANIEWADKHFLEFINLLQHIMIIFLGVEMISVVKQ